MWQSMHMAAEHDLHTPFNPPAAESRAAETNVETHVLDLTTVCVRSGAVLLPRALIGLFEAEEVVALSDGGELRLEFKAPRTLAGLTEFFELHGLRANDRLLFTFEDGALHLSARKRERNDPAGSRRAAGKRVAIGSPEQGAPGPAAPARAAAKPSEWQLAVEKQEAQVIAERRAEALNQKGISVDRFSGPVGELVPQAPRRREPAAPGKADRQRGGYEQPSVDAQRAADAHPESAAGQPEGVVRAVVTRVRLEGGVPAGTSGAARPKELASAHDVWARRQHARWQPLDTVIAARHDPRTFDADFPDTVVRAFRRGPNGSLRPEPELLPKEDAAPVTRAKPSERRGRVTGTPVTGAPLTASRRGAQPREIPDQEYVFQPFVAASGDDDYLLEREVGEQGARGHVADEHGVVEPWAGGKRAVVPDLPLGAPAVERTGLRAAALESALDQHSDPERGAHRHHARRNDADPRGVSESLAEDLPAKGQRKGVIARLSGLRLSLGRERGSYGGGVHELDAPAGPVGGRERFGATGFQAPLQAPPKAFPPLPSVLKGGPASGNAPAAQAYGSAGDQRPESLARPAVPSVGTYRPERGGGEPAAEPERRAHPSARLAVLEDALLDADVSVKPSTRHDQLEADGPKAPPVGAAVEEDMAFIEGYLLRPGTPAIVRSIDLAERLGMSPERAARAMERLSEQRERFSRIRDGAYMVRQVR